MIIISRLQMPMDMEGILMHKKLLTLLLPIFFLSLPLSPSQSDDFLLEVFNQDDWGFVKDRLVTGPKASYDHTQEKLVYMFLSAYVGVNAAFLTNIFTGDFWNLGNLFSVKNLFITVAVGWILYFVLNEKVIKKHMAKRDALALKNFLAFWEKYEKRTPESMKPFFESLVKWAETDDDNPDSFHAEMCGIIQTLLEKRKKAKAAGEPLDVKKALDDVLEYFGVEKAVG